jgi:hypothetical protein
MNAAAADEVITENTLLQDRQSTGGAMSLEMAKHL